MSWLKRAMIQLPVVSIVVWPSCLMSGLRGGRFEVAEGCSHRLVVRLQDLAVITHEGEQRDRLGGAEGEVPTRLVLAFLPPFQNDSVR